MRKLIFIHLIILWVPNDALPAVFPIGPLYITNGGSLALSCETDQDAGLVLWKRNGFTNIQITDTTVCIFRKSSNEDTYNYSVTCDQQRRFNIVKYVVDISDHNTIWSCQAYSPNNTDLGTSSVLTVLMHVPVGSVQLLNGSTWTLIENQSAVFVCETDACRPSADIYWMKDGKNITNVPTNVTAVNMGSDLFVSIGTLTYTAQRGDNSKILTCGSYNGLNSVQISRSLTITIYYPPSIIALTSPYKVIEYHSLNVTCQVSSNPPPDRVFWTPGGEGSLPSTLYLSNVSRNSRRNYSCTAQNTMTPTFGNQQNGTTTSQIQVDVLYPPSMHGLISSYKVIENKPLNVTCQVRSNPPPDQIIWTPTGEGSVPSSLYFASVSRNNSGTYTCTAQNTMTPTVGAHQTGMNTSQIHVDVLYSPSLHGLAISYRVIEKQPLNVTCQVSSNPPPDQISWSPSGEDSIPSRLYVSSVSRNQSGMYSCTATNTMTPTAGTQQNGTSTRQIQVDVLYAAMITKFGPKGNCSEILENSNLELYCHVESNPYSVISLSFGDVLISTIRNSNELIHNTTAGCLNAGKYTCSATNSVMNGVTVSADISLKVQCGPRLDHRKNISTVYYRSLNDSVTLEVNVIAYPEPTYIVWYHRREETDKWQLVANQPTSSGGLLSSITVHIGSQADFGDYLVNMTNSFGSYDLIFYVIPESPPKMVNLFYIGSFIANQIEFHFKPGFNGGRIQTCIIEYKSTATFDSPWRNSSVRDLKEETANGIYFVNISQPPPGNYEYRMYSWNDIGRSPYSAVISIFIPEGTCKTSCAATMENTNQMTPIIISSVLFCLAACLFVATVVLIVRSRSGIYSGCVNGRSETDANNTDNGLCQPRIYDGLSTLQAGTSGETRDDYEQLNYGNAYEYEDPSNDHTTIEYEEPSRSK